MSVLRAVYEILVPPEKKMELRQAVIHSSIIASVGKYTMPWIIDRAVSVLLLTNLRAPQKGHVILKNISANLLIPRILFRVSPSRFLPLIHFFYYDKRSRFNDNSNGVLNKKRGGRLFCLFASVWGMLESKTLQLPQTLHNKTKENRVDNAY